MLCVGSTVTLLEYFQMELNKLIEYLQLQKRKAFIIIADAKALFENVKNRTRTNLAMTLDV